MDFKQQRFAFLEQDRLIRQETSFNIATAVKLVEKLFDSILELEFHNHIAFESMYVFDCIAYLRGIASCWATKSNLPHEQWDNEDHQSCCQDAIKLLGSVWDELEVLTQYLVFYDDGEYWKFCGEPDTDRFSRIHSPVIKITRYLINLERESSPKGHYPYTKDLGSGE
jgi:hypothetical protein